MTGVFISYSRKDAAFVQGLYDFLSNAGRDVWVDWEDIPAASQWEQDIDDNIDAAESVVFVVSSNSLASEYCAEEFSRAQKGGKRIVPIACEGVDPAVAPQGLRQLNWIWCREGDDRDAAHAKLTGALDTDLEWARAHTRLLVRAVEWETRQDSSLLLRGRDLGQAEQLLAANAAKEPTPTELQQRYAHASRRAASRRQRVLLGSVVLALAVSIGLGVVALLQRNTADERARVAHSQALAAQAMQALSTKPTTALADAVDAVETSWTPEARLALRRAILANPVDYVIPFKGKGVTAAEDFGFSDDGKLLLGLTPGGTLHVWRSANGRRVTAIPRTKQALFGQRDDLLSTNGSSVRLDGLGRSQSTVRHLRPGERAVGIAFAKDVPLALVAGRGAAEVLNVLTGSTIRLHAPRVSVVDAIFSSDGSRVLTQNARFSEIRVWDARSGRLLTTLPDCGSARCEVVSPDGSFVATGKYYASELWSIDGRRRIATLEADRVVFSPDGSLVVGVEPNGRATVLRSSSGKLVAALPGSGDLFRPGFNNFTPFKPGAAFSPDDHLVAIADSDGIVRVWELASSEQVAAVPAGWANQLAFAPYGGLLAAMTWNGTVVVASAPASVALRTNQGPLSEYRPNHPPLLSPDGRRIMSPINGDGAVGVWSVDGQLEHVLPAAAQGVPGRVLSVPEQAFSDDGTVAAAEDQTVGVQACVGAANRCGTVVGHVGGRIPPRLFWTLGWPLLLDSHGSLVVIGSKAWRTATGRPVAALQRTVAFSPDGRRALVSRGGTSSIVLVPSGRTLVGFRGAGLNAVWEEVQQGAAGTPAFSPDGRHVLIQSNDDNLRLWDASSGALLARLGRPGESVERFSFIDRGRLALVVFGDRVATFSASSGSLASSTKGQFEAISSDGTLAANPTLDGSVEIVDLRTGVRVGVQTDTALQLQTVSFGPTDGLLVADDNNGDVYVVRCTICAAEDVLLQHARSILAMLSRFRPSPPPVAVT